MRVNTGQKVGIAGLGIFLLGIAFTALLPWAGITFGAAGYLVGVVLAGVGSILFTVGVFWAWIVGIEDATRAWDAVRRPVFCPVCGARYPENLGHYCPKDGAELRPLA